MHALLFNMIHLRLPFAEQCVPQCRPNFEENLGQTALVNITNAITVKLEEISSKYASVCSAIHRKTHIFHRQLCKLHFGDSQYICMTYTTSRVIIESIIVDI